MGNFIFKSKYTLLIANSWSKTKDEVKSAAIWRCTKKESCQFKEKHNNESKHFCTCNPNNVKTSLCIGIKCKNIVRKNKARATKCKYTMEHNAQSPTDCENFTSIQTLGKAEIASQGGKVPCKNVCSFSVIKSGVHAIRSSGVEKFLKVVISKFDDLEAYGNMTNFFDIIDKCSDDTKCQVFVNRHKSSIFLCVFSTTTDSICVTLKCREVHDTSTDTNNMDTNAENWRTLQTAWKNWKKEIVLVSAGVVLLSGISGFLFGVCFSVFRKSRPIKRYLERKHVYTVNSELYEQISDTSSIIQGNMYNIKTIPDKKSKSFNPCETPNCNPESETSKKTEFEYSHIYNILQPNYGSRSVPQPVYSSPLERENAYSLQRCLSLQMLPKETLKTRSSSMMSI